jgi:hypothetical protein
VGIIFEVGAEFVVEIIQDDPHVCGVGGHVEIGLLFWQIVA